MIRPIRYSLSLDLTNSHDVYSGDVVIDFEARSENDRIALDARDVVVSRATLNGAPVRVETGGEKVFLLADQPLSGRGTAELSFHGVVRDEPCGLFRSGASLVTTLQPAFAHWVFPCIDDLRASAIFEIAVKAPPSHMVITSMTSSKMPPHLVSVSAGPFDVATSDGDGVPIRLFVPQGESIKPFVLEAASDAVRFLSRYVGAPYPWPKLDLVVVPDLDAAAVESVSVVHFRHSSLAIESPRVRDLIAHEIAHQWFGCLVRPASWNDLWLSEGFATWLAGKAGGSESDVRNARRLRVALAGDSLRSSRALRAVEDHDNLQELFDPVAYGKGAALLSMLATWLGEETLRNGLTGYLHRHAHGSATTSDLWQALESESGQLITEAASAVSEHVSVPTLAFAWHGENVSITRTAGTSHPIPVNLKAGYVDGSVEQYSVLLDTETANVITSSEVKWVFGNAKASGYYRCTYPSSTHIPSSALTPAEAVVHLSDAWDGLWLRTSDMTEYLDTAQRLSSIPEAAALAADHTGDLQNILATGERAVAFESWRHTVLGAPPAPDPPTAAWNELKWSWDGRPSFDQRSAIAALSASADPALRQDIATFFAARPVDGITRTLQRTLETIQNRIAFREREQLPFDAWLTRGLHPDVIADESLGRAHAFLNALAAGFHGMLVQRSWLDGLGVPVPEWMQPADAVQKVIAAVERRIVAVYRGTAVVDDAALNLAARLREDLIATAALCETVLDSKEVASVVARQIDGHERVLRGAITFAALFGAEDTSRQLRNQLRSTEQNRRHARELLQRVREGDWSATTRSALRTAAASVPALCRSQADGLASLVARFAVRTGDQQCSSG